MLYPAELRARGNLAERVKFEVGSIKTITNLPTLPRNVPLVVLTGTH
jgi:hypothetical protein